MEQLQGKGMKELIPIFAAMAAVCCSRQPILQMSFLMKTK